MRLIDLTNQRFGRLIVTGRAGFEHKQATWKCVCDCGNEKIVMGQNLRRGLTTSCGCYQKERAVEEGAKTVKHGHGYGTRTYRTWQSLRQRCENPKNKDYELYGAKGVKVCERWKDFPAFFEDMGERPHGMTIDRINPFGNYEPNNCRWADYFVQNNNMRKHWKGGNDVSA